MSIGMKASVAGADVGTADARNLLFSSENNSLKVKATALGTLTLGTAGVGTATIAHGLSYAPSYRTFTETIPGSGNWFSDENYPDGSEPFPGAVTVDTIVDSTNLYMVFGLGSASTAYKYKYYIFYDEAL